MKNIDGAWFGKGKTRGEEKLLLKLNEGGEKYEKEAAELVWKKVANRIMVKLKRWWRDRRFPIFAKTHFLNSARKRELFQYLAPLLWNSFGTIAALLQYLSREYSCLTRVENILLLVVSNTTDKLSNCSNTKLWIFSSVFNVRQHIGCVIIPKKPLEACGFG
ncbi:hypothetical protein L1987_34905 [Smallanthus sonchifolius]|uniref:Uncharacterized protein n=1 Tax=Smallanthus sonchifolius TaxID=185202 RepID=A0ACB9HWD4_9ASTR|nr:hypothetical protein L1987_34905 [Smallanthus sonchifolius]